MVDISAIFGAHGILASHTILATCSIMANHTILASCAIPSGRATLAMCVTLGVGARLILALHNHGHLCYPSVMSRLPARSWPFTQSGPAL